MTIINNEDDLNIDQFNIPILFMIFNKLSESKRVFESIKKCKPLKIYLASDGPRESFPEEKEIIESIRNYVVSNIDWDCKVYKLFRDQNLGCKYACSGAVNWFFENEEMGIILEDDTLPNQSFFKYCEELLNYYKEDERVGMIAGNAPINNHNFEKSYYFSRYVRFWGWASWRRAWQNYDVEYENFYNFIKLGGLSSVSRSSREEKYWKKIANSGITNTWDYQWLFASWQNSMLTVIPHINLVTNIGFGQGATHTVNIDSHHNNAESFQINLPLTHPDFIFDNKFLDDKAIEQEFLPSFKRRFLYRFNKFKKLFL